MRFEFRSFSSTKTERCVSDIPILFGFGSGLPRKEGLLVRLTLHDFVGDGSSLREEKSHVSNILVSTRRVRF